MDSVLICAVGETPQVVTETLYALRAHEQSVPSEVHIVTTEAGRERVRRDLTHDRDGRLWSLCRDLGIDQDRATPEVHVITDGAGRPMQDIRSREENAAAGRWIAAFVAEQAGRADVLLHASLAGGRKTMSYYLGHALQMYGRRRDRLTHVLVSEAFEGHPDFFYPPNDPVTLATRPAGKLVRTDEARVTLIDVPFVRLRDHLDLGSIEGDFRQVVDGVQRQIDRPPEVVVDLAAGSVAVGAHRCRWGRTQRFALYVHLLLERVRAERDGSGAWLSAEQLLETDHRLDLWELADDLVGCPGAAALGELLAGDALNPNVSEKGYQSRFSQERSKINKALEKAFRGTGLPERLSIGSLGRNPARYRVDVPAARLRFVEGGA